MVALFTKEDERKKVFTLEGDKQRVIQDLQALIGVDPDDDEHGINFCDAGSPGCAVEHPSTEDRAAEEEEIKALIVKIEEGQFDEWFDRIPRKKNGTFAKGRVTEIWRGSTFEQLYEDSYGYYAPELIIRTNDDMSATLRVESRIRKW